VLYRERFGVNVHPSYPDYRNRLPELIDWLHSMGYVWVRSDDPAGASKLPGFKVQTVVSTVRDANLALAAGTAVVELTNEPKPANMATVKGTNAAIVAAVGNRVPIAQSSLSQSKYAASLGTQPGVHQGSIHPYRGNHDDKTWASVSGGFIASAQTVAPWLPFDATETGAHDYFGPNNLTNHPPTPDDVFARQIVPDAISLFRRGVRRVFHYQAWDTPSSNGGIDSEQSHFGLRGKPAEAVLRAHLAEFGDRDDLAFLDDAAQMERIRAAAENLMAAVA
jgi:hypothetical protein